jgi:hypothetical protein
LELAALHLPRRRQQLLAFDIPPKQSRPAGLLVSGPGVTVYVLMLAPHEGRPLHEVRMRTKAGVLTVDHACQRITSATPRT